MGVWVYLLECSDGLLYVGQTDDLEARVVAHQSGQIPGYTRSRLPVHLVWSEYFATRDEALQVERQIKGWSRAKKTALIQGDWLELQRLARSRSAPP